MRRWNISRAALCVVAHAALPACGSSPRAPAKTVATASPGAPTPAAAITFSGTAVYDDGSPAGGAMFAVTGLQTGARDAIFVADGNGHFEAALAGDEYALAVASARGFAWIEAQVVPNRHAMITLSTTCHRVTGRAGVRQPGTRIEFARFSDSHGDTFVVEPRADGAFAVCLPEGGYAAQLDGGTVSRKFEIELPTPAPLHLDGFDRRDVELPPHPARRLEADLSQVSSDIVRRGARIVGLGEATHGSAEFVPLRAELTFELIRHADVRALLFEFDAIAAEQLDAYINGGDVDLTKALPGLGFWITDTDEFTHFLQQLRIYNTSTNDRVHLWGVDVQNTALPVQVLLGHASALGILVDDRDLLERVSHRGGGPVATFTETERSRIAQLLMQLSTPRSTSLSDLRIAIAARSLAVQLTYFDGDLQAHYSDRRDGGMADLASFIVAQTGVKRACLWAHDGHVTKQWSVEGTSASLGQRLARAGGYYAVGFYAFQGSSRAWDATGTIGVISHPIPSAPAYTLEGAVMAATGAPEIAWVSVKQLASALGHWFETPHYVREMGHTYFGETATLALRDIGAEFDAIVVAKTVHDSSPTPTGVRRVVK